VIGTIVTHGGRTVTVDMTWEGTGALEATTNTTTLPGFTGHFQSLQRDAVGAPVASSQTHREGEVLLLKRREKDTRLEEVKDAWLGVDIDCRRGSYRACCDHVGGRGTPA
jgi:hypothetical protein